MQTLIVGATFGFPKAEPLQTFVSTLLEYKGMMPFPLSFSV
jgi:hypothetical protein